MSVDEVWPNFFIVGAPKAGTTSLYEYLKRHPEISMPAKDTYFFCQGGGHSAIKDRAEYLALFSGSDGYSAIGEATANYLGDEAAPEAIHRESPDARIIISLRDPIERAFSHYLMFIREGRESRSFLKAVQSSPLAEEYVEFSLYCEATKRYLDTFGGQNSLILMFEDLVRDPRETTERVVRFLGLPTEPLRDLGYPVHNPGLTPRSRTSAAVLRVRRRMPIHSIPVVPRSWRRFIRFRILNKPGKPDIDRAAVDFLRGVFESDVRDLERLLEKPLPTLRKGW